jgi:mono/diheme cytochrome c family protein
MTRSEQARRCTLRCLLILTTALWQVVPAAESESARAPALIWKGSCAYCHGTPIAQALFGRSPGVTAIELYVRNGVSAMPPFHRSEITDAELVALARWIDAQPLPPLPTPSVPQPVESQRQPAPSGAAP